MPPISTLNSGMSVFFVPIAIVMPITRVISPSPCRTVLRIFSGSRFPSTVPRSPPTITEATLIKVPVIMKPLSNEGVTKK